MGNFGAILDEMFKALKGVFSGLPKLIHVILWGLSAIIILPCVFVTHFFYPMWEEWGKEF